MKSPHRSSAVLSLVLVLSVGCHRQPEPEQHEAPRAVTSSASALQAGPAPEALLAPAEPPPAAREVPALSWTDPPGWSRAASTSMMRLATYRVPRAKGDPEDAEMTVFHFGSGPGGGVEANFDRWVGQFRDVDRSKAIRSERTAQGLPEHVLEIPSGTYAAGMGPDAPTSPKEHFGLLGAIVETPGGAYFFKLIGPSQTLKAERAAFLRLLDGVNQPS